MRVKCLHHAKDCSELVLLAFCNVWSRQHAFAMQKVFDTRIKPKGLRSRIRRLTNYQAQKHVQTTSEIQLTTFQQRQGILPDSSISNNCHVFMYLSPTDNRLLDIKEVPQFQPPYSFLSHLYPEILSDKVTRCKSLKTNHGLPYWSDF